MGVPKAAPVTSMVPTSLPVRSATVHKVPLSQSGCLSGWWFSLSLAGYIGAIASLYTTGAATFRDAELWLSLSFLAYLVYGSLVEWHGYGWARCDVPANTVGQRNHLLRSRKVQWPWCLTLTAVLSYCAVMANGALMTFASLSGRYDVILPGLMLGFALIWQALHSVQRIRPLLREAVPPARRVPGKKKSERGQDGYERT
jgi:hypothetical protein